MLLINKCSDWKKLELCDGSVCTFSLSLSAAETFDPKKFFEMVGMKAMSAENVKKVFQVLDVDGSGFIEEGELKWGTHTDAKKQKKRLSQPNRLSYNAIVSFLFLQHTATFHRFVLKGFSKEGRDLTDAETTAFLKAADKDGDGKIGIDGEKREEHCIELC